MAVNINVPSQVKTYANLAAFPASGVLKTIYIAEDTNKTYRWTGSVYVEVSASASGITIGTTAITSGTVGRVLFEGAGNVVQESANLFWDNTNGRLGIGTSSPATPLEVRGTTIRLGNGATSNLEMYSDGSVAAIQSFNNSTGLLIRTLGTQNLRLNVNTSTNGIQVTGATGNVLINTTTDAGFRLDVNGTFRATLGQLLVGGGHYLEGVAASSTDASMVFRRTANNGWVRFGLGVNSPVQLAANTNTGEAQLFAGSGGYFPTFYSNGAERMRIPTTGNVLINTTTDAGFRLDVNGTARVSNEFTVKRTNATAILDEFTTNSATSCLWLTSTKTTSTFSIAGEGTNTLINAPTGYVGFFQALTERARFASGTGNLLLNTTTDVASSLLTMNSTTKGFLPPRMTTTQKNAIASPASGLMVYDTTLNLISVYNGTTWITL